MKKNRTFYRITTGIITLVMLFSIYKMYAPDYLQLGFPLYFRTELVVAKLLGLAVLLIPGIPSRWKEWAYAGFGIVLISATVAHYSSGDGLLRSLEPMIFMVLLVLSHRYWRRMNAGASGYNAG